MGRESAALALAAYIKKIGDHEAHEPDYVQVSDLITDLLLSYDDDTVDAILQLALRERGGEMQHLCPNRPPL